MDQRLGCSIRRSRQEAQHGKRETLWIRVAGCVLESLLACVCRKRGAIGVTQFQIVTGNVKGELDIPWNRKLIAVAGGATEWVRRHSVRSRRSGRILQPFGAPHAKSEVGMTAIFSQLPQKLLRIVNLNRQHGGRSEFERDSGSGLARSQ